MTQMNIYKNRNRFKDIEHGLIIAKGGKWERDGGKFGVSRCKPVYVRWINKVLLYSTGNYIQYSVINHNGKELFLKKNIYICINESLCCTV